MQTSDLCSKDNESIWLVEVCFNYLDKEMVYIVAAFDNKSDASREVNALNKKRFFSTTWIMFNHDFCDHVFGLNPRLSLYTMIDYATEVEANFFSVPKY